MVYIYLIRTHSLELIIPKNDLCYSESGHTRSLQLKIVPVYVAHGYDLQYCCFLEPREFLKDPFHGDCMKSESFS